MKKNNYLRLEEMKNELEKMLKFIYYDIMDNECITLYEYQVRNMVNKLNHILKEEIKEEK